MKCPKNVVGNHIPGSGPKSAGPIGSKCSLISARDFCVFFNIYTPLQHLSKADSGQKCTGRTLFGALSQELLALFDHRLQLFSQMHGKWYVKFQARSNNFCPSYARKCLKNVLGEPYSGLWPKKYWSYRNQSSLSARDFCDFFEYLHVPMT